MYGHRTEVATTSELLIMVSSSCLCTAQSPQPKELSFVKASRPWTDDDFLGKWLL